VGGFLTVRQNFGEVLARLRREKALTQTALARAAGFSPNYISELESGRKGSNPPRQTVMALAEALAVLPEVLLRAAGHPITEVDVEATGRMDCVSFLLSEPTLDPSEQSLMVSVYQHLQAAKRQAPSC
jgi:transcriptional regulator with XRE-family HTH domain